MIVLVSTLASGCPAPSGQGAAGRLAERSPNDETVGAHDTMALGRAIAYARAEAGRDLKAVLVAREEHLLVEEYFNGHGRDSLLDVRSVAKSITSALLGIAIADGAVAGIDARVFPLLAAGPGTDTDKSRITVEHLLTMMSGLDADDDDPGSPGNEDRLASSPDWLAFALAVPVRRPAGEEWVYASVNTFLLGAVIEQAYQQPLSEFARDRLFAPLGITTFRWASTPDNRTVAQGNIWLRAVDMARIGQLYLDAGRLGDSIIIPGDWIEQSTIARAAVPWADYDAFGYSWFVHDLDIGGTSVSYFAASGNGGNKIYVVPEKRLVVVIQSTAYNMRRGHVRSLELLRTVLGADPQP